MSTSRNNIRPLLSDIHESINQIKTLGELGSSWE